jgi:peptide/nickel transport system substrate-binding protein
MGRTRYLLGMPGIIVFTSALISLLVYLAGTGGSPAFAQAPATGGKPKYGGILRLAEREPPNLDPHLSVSFNPQNIGSLIYNGLVRFPYGHEQKDPYDLTIMPDLAERWEYTDDKTVVFYLRKGVKFHDKPPVNGREVKAPDVKYSLERFAAKSGFRARFDDIDHIDVVDDYTVKIVTKYPFAPLLVNLASPSHNFIFPKEAEDKYGDFNKVEAAIGTGPFILERYDPNVKTVFKRNPAYFRPGQPYVDGVEWLVLDDPSSGLAMYRSGQIDCGPGPWWGVRQ